MPIERSRLSIYYYVLKSILAKNYYIFIFVITYSSYTCTIINTGNNNTNSFIIYSENYERHPLNNNTLGTTFLVTPTNVVAQKQ